MCAWVPSRRAVAQRSAARADPHARRERVGHHARDRVVQAEHVAQLVGQHAEQVDARGGDPLARPGEPSPAGGVDVDQDTLARRRSLRAFATVSAGAGAAPAAAVLDASRRAPSLSRIVTTAVPSAIVAPPVAFDSTTLNVSVGSAVRSPTIAIVTVAVVWPAANVTVPVLDWKSEPATANALPTPATCVANATVIGVLDAAESRSVTVTFSVFLSPSVTLTSSTAIDGAGGGGGAVSSSTMATLPVPSAIVRPCGFDSTTVKPSSPSTAASPSTVTVIVADVCPAAKVAV